MFDVLLDRINSFTDLWTAWMVTTSIDAAFVFLVVGVVWLLIRRRVAPQVGILLFLLVPLKLLIPIPVSAPESIAAWYPSTMVTNAIAPKRGAVELMQSASESVPTESNPVVARLANTAEQASAHVQHDKAAIESPYVAHNVASTIARKKVLAPNQSTLFRLTAAFKTLGKLKLSAWVMFAWSAVCGFLALRFVMSEFCFRRRLRSASTLAIDELPLDFQELCQVAGVRRTVRLIVSDAVAAPAVHGIFRPTIILAKETLAQLSVEQLRWALLHELSHIRRHDLLVILFQRIASCLFFFHPAVWIANRVVHQQREYACDDRAMLQNDGPSTAAGDAFVQILRAANGAEAHATMALSVLGMGPRAVCQKRLMRMLDTDRNIVARPSWISLCCVLLIAAVTLPQFAAAHQDAPADDGNSKVTSATPANGLAAPNIKQPWRFELQVNDMQGDPVANAHIGVRRNIRDFGELKIGERLGETKHRILYKCDERGRFTVDFDGRPNGLQLFVEHDGYEPYVANWAHTNNASQTPHKFTAKLDKAWTFGGQIVDESGSPIKDAELRLRIEYKKRPGDHSQWGTGDKVTTDAEGRWLFRRVPNIQDSVSVEINHLAFSPRVMVLARSEFEIDPNNDAKGTGLIKLTRGISLSGKVSDDKGQPLVGASLKIRFSNVIREATTDSKGRYTITGCQSKETDIAVTAPGMAFEKKKIVITQDGDDVDFELKPSKGIRVRVVDEAGKPMPKARIFFQQWRGDHAYFVFEDVNQYADENGVWEWNEAPVDEITADICRPKGMNLSDTKLIAREEEYVFTPPKQLFVSGTVSDAVTGENIKSFRVIPGGQQSEDTAFWSERDALSASDGKYRMKHFSQTYDSHLVRVEADGYKTVTSRDIMSDEVEVNLDFTLEPAENMTSQVVDPQGNPVYDAIVVLGTKGSQVAIDNGRLDQSGSNNIRRTRTDSDGKFEFPAGLSAFHLFVLHDQGFVHLKPDETAKEEPESDQLPDKITLTAWSTLEGTYFLGMAPGPATQIKLWAAEKAFKDHSDEFYLTARSRTTTDAKGKFRFDRVFPGENIAVTSVPWGAIESTSSTQLTFPAVAGETKRIRLGGNGTAVTGRLLLPDGQSENFDWKNFWIKLRENRPRVAVPLRIGPNGNRLINRARPPAAEEKKQSRTFSATPDREGKFRIEDVPEGDWIFSAGTGDHQISSETQTVSIVADDLADGDANVAKDLGDIQTRLREDRR